MFQFKRDTVYVGVIVIALLSAGLGGMPAEGLTFMFFALWGAAHWHGKHIEKQEYEDMRREEELNEHLRAEMDKIKQGKSDASG